MSQRDRHCPVHPEILQQRAGSSLYMSCPKCDLDDAVRRIEAIPFRAPSQALLELLDYVQRWHEQRYGTVPAELGAVAPSVSDRGRPLGEGSAV